MTLWRHDIAVSLYFWATTGDVNEATTIQDRGRGCDPRGLVRESKTHEAEAEAKTHEAEAKTYEAGDETRCFDREFSLTSLVTTRVRVFIYGFRFDLWLP